MKKPFNSVSFIKLIPILLGIVLDYVSRPARSHAPVTPRIMLIGPYGSGRRTQANAMAKKYGVVNVSMSMLLKEAVAHQSLLGVAIKPHMVKQTKSKNTLFEYLNLRTNLKNF